MKKIGIIILCFFLLFVGYVIYEKNNSKENKSIQTVDEIDTNISIDEKIDFSNAKNETILLNGEDLIIQDGGVYTLTGEILNGMITVDTNEAVKLILNGVTVKNADGPALFVNSAQAVYLETVEGSINTFIDGSTRIDDTLDGAIYSKDDLVLLGDGTLVVESNYQDGIVSKDGLKIESGTYHVDALDDGIRGKDYVYILDGNFTIASDGDAIKATNTEDTELGYVYIENGVFQIESTLDGIQAETKLLIQNGEFTIITGGGTKTTSTMNNSNMWYRGINTSSSSTSAKGMKAGNSIVLKNGTYTFDTSDDAIHSNEYVAIQNGTYQIVSGDDGIHADTTLIIEGGVITIDKSYEGIESANITIREGIISVVASDDGINVAGGNDSSSMGRPGENRYTENTDQILIIDGGTVSIDASGDGIDVNGSAYINGGMITVDGPINDGNAALDYDSVFAVNGGIFIAAGSSGMAQAPSSGSEQATIMINFGTIYSAFKTVTIEDASGNTVTSYAPSKSFSSIVISSPDLELGNTYTILVDGTSYQSVTLSNTITTIGNFSMMGRQPGRR